MRAFKGLMIVAVAAAVCSSASAFDGKRQGFVLGAGLGSNVYGDASPEPSGYKRQGLALRAFVGYAQNEHNLLALEGNVAFSTTGNKLVERGFYGPTWYRFFGSTGRAFYSVIGLGFYRFETSPVWDWGDVSEDEAEHETGFGYHVGGGYEFAKHFQVGAFLSGGHTTFSHVDYDHYQVSVLMTVTIY